MDMRCLDIKKEASNTCTWLLKNKAYQEWQDIPQGLLWIRGKPGAGRSSDLAMFSITVANILMQASRRWSNLLFKTVRVENGPKSS
jgi:hypothetical protein